MDLLRGEHLVKRFGDKDIVRNIHISVPKGYAVAIAGETGSGKSTLLKMLAGLLEPDEGHVYFKGKIVEGPLTKLIPGHDKIAYLSQYFELRNNYRVEEIFDYSNRLDEQWTLRLFDLCHVAHLSGRRTDQLSGGERQRVALARVLLTNPDVLLLDEPFSNLDLQQKTELKKAVAAVAEALGLTVVLVSHDAADILPWADVVHVMKDGAIMQSASAKDIYYHPVNKYVAGLFGHYTSVNKTLRDLFAAHDIIISESVDILRPEMLSLTAGHREGLIHGVVKSILFMGSYSQIEVIVNENSLLCYHNDHSLRSGDKVSIAINSR